MKKVILIYTSSTGSTEAIAETIREELEQNAVHVTVKDSFVATPDELQEYDGILIGTYTWDGGVVPDEFMDFYEELDYEELTGKIAAVFGSGDSYYTKTFGAALKLFAEKLAEIGAELVLPNFLVDLYPEENDLIAAKQYGKKFSEFLLKK
ncbi:flavodoxin domain-containing protein [Lederbergia sp. NSJ-179]|uniref:flavodoxin domain-containing protein n=1 Tax=Lederbergia sp. NSJ-179 TaxID=2931402 RepID=UPI001FD4C3B0|nr:flavodoxin domain-containing protein [Lederbergia sp. NSJ-179]MCJ7840825.1 flavodoxin domain-containing protein [Lederbergia sp. NSJ-179]